jgi:hypothetical protein
VVTCSATTGDVQLNITTTGSAPDPDGYTVKVDGVLIEVPDEFTTGFTPLRLLSNGGYLLERLGPGDHGIELSDLAANCAVNGPNPRTVPVTVGVVAPLAIGVVCGP